MTDRTTDHKVLQLRHYLCRYALADGTVPETHALANYLGVSTQTALHYLARLVHEGFLVSGKEGRKHRYALSESARAAIASTTSTLDQQSVPQHTGQGTGQVIDLQRVVARRRMVAARTATQADRG